MKTPRITFIVAILFIRFTSFAQEEMIKLNVEEGKTYVFESKFTITEFDMFGKATVKHKSNREVHVEIEHFDGKNLVFLSKVVSGSREDQFSKVKSIINYKFPPVVNDVNERFKPINEVSRLLSLTGLRYRVDLESNNTEFINRQEALEEVKKLMIAKGFNKQFIEKGIGYFQQDSTIWQKINIHEVHQFIVYFNNSLKTENGLKSPFLDRSFQLNENEEFIYDVKANQSGIAFSKVELSKRHGFPLIYYEAKHDSINSKLRRLRTADNVSRLIEKKTIFLEEFQTGKDLFTFKYSIENPKDSFITLYYMDNPYSLENTIEVLKLNENNEVTFQTKLQGPTLVSLWNNAVEYKNRMLYLVVEPTDTIIVKYSGTKDNSPWEISGTNVTANRLISSLYREMKSLFDVRPHQIITKDDFDEVQKLVEVFDAYTKTNNISLNDILIPFIRNELIALEYLHYFAFLNRYYSTIIAGKQKNEDELIIEREMLKIAEEKIKDFDIHDYYNDYGIFSRRLSIYYFHYYLNNLSRVKVTEIYDRSKRSFQEEFEIGKMILGGSIFYRVLAYRIISSMTQKDIAPTVPSASYESLEDALKLINQLINQSYSEYFKQHLQTFRDTRLNWENENHIPVTTFYKPDGSTVKLEEVLKGKPTVLYINEHWATYRYDFDRDATNNPNIRYVMIMEGDNLEEWQEYIERAEPVAEQLLLLNNKTTLDDIFLRSKTLYIVYDKNGKLVEYDVEEHRTAKLAKQSLEQKKELNKSQLQIIVLLLSVILISLIAGFIIWKWRTRQRLRKEQQQRRLRELELTAIRSQMNPHFLFNCLNSVQNLVQQNKGREAHLYLADFAGLIRKVLQNSEKEEVSLAEELEMVQQYLNLVKLRFDFDFQITTGEGIDPHNTPVPPMLLQPFAENAVIHGLQHKEGSRLLKIEVSREHARLAHKAEDTRLAADNRLAHTSSILIIIEDNGIGRVAAQKLATGKNGKGSHLMQERLEILQEKQGEKYRLQITDLTENGATGTRVEIWVPEEK
jgi:hypothetical protein